MKSRSRRVENRCCTPRTCAAFGADEIVVGEAQPVPQPVKLTRNGGGKLLRRAPGQRGGALDLLPVFVRAGEKPRIDAQRALAPRNGIADDGRVGVAQVRPRSAFTMTSTNGRAAGAVNAYSTIVCDAIARRKRALSNRYVFPRRDRRARAESSVPLRRPGAHPWNLPRHCRRVARSVGPAGSHLEIPYHGKTVTSAACKSYFRRCATVDFVYKGSYTGQYCVSDELYVDGPAGTICPDCGT